MTRRGFIRRALAAVCGAVACAVVGRRADARPTHDLRAICRAVRAALPTWMATKVRVFESRNHACDRDEVVVLMRVRRVICGTWTDGIYRSNNINVGFGFEVGHPLLAHPGRAARRVRYAAIRAAGFRGPWRDESPREYWWMARGMPWPKAVNGMVELCTS